jgi:uncharacterized cupredoxin-like copper-binding protein
MSKLVAVPAFLIASLAPLAASQAQPAGPEVVTVELSNFRFSPSELALQRGHTYRLHLVNMAGGGHDFSAPEFFAASTIAPADRARVTNGEVKLAGKQSVDVTVTPQTSGAYKLTCTHFLHAGFGMKGRIVVQ